MGGGGGGGRGGGAWAQGGEGTLTVTLTPNVNMFYTICPYAEISKYEYKCLLIRGRPVRGVVCGGGAGGCRRGFGFASPTSKSCIFFQTHFTPLSLPSKSAFS